MKAKEYWIVKTEGFDGKVYDTDPRTWKYPGAIRLDLVKKVREVVRKKPAKKKKVRE